ncbi:hypothetical protein HPB49_006636 [Dermacentor silvarum]|uniref:Uncharacterized protein n=1 Tax=Dermacentor silvarum TaxID=543639 RepID=A0ACB8CQF7_DERSI|nr:hypothetical protein HPB49_006636 [Dermacentor silvarum]
MDGDVLESSALVGKASWFLKWAFFGCSFLSIVELLQRPNLAPRRPVCFTLCDLGYLVCNVIALVALVFVNVLVFNETTEAAVGYATAVALVWLTISAVMQRCKGMSASNLLCALHAIYFVASLNDFLLRKDLTSAQEAVYCSPDELSLATTSCLLLMVAALGSFLCAFFRSSPVYDKDDIESLVNTCEPFEKEEESFIIAPSCIVSKLANEVLLSGFMEYVSLRCTIQLKALMQAALFTKTTRMSARALSETPTGYLVSLVGVDGEQLNTAVIVFSQAVSGLLCFPLVLWMLAKRVGVLPVIGCVAWQLTSLALFVPASKKRVNQHRDERLRKMADTLSCVRLVKFYAWEDTVVRVINRFREREGFFVFLANLLDGFIDSLQNSSNSMAG